MRHSLQRSSRFVLDPWPGARILRIVELGEDDARGPWLALFAATSQFEVERRRLRPVPPGWYELTDDELVRLFSVADPARAPHRGDRLREIERHVSLPASRIPQPGSAEWHALMQFVELEYLTLALELLEVRAELTAMSRASIETLDEISAA